MLRPETAQDVLDLVRQSNLVDASALTHFLSQLSSTETRDGVLGLLVAQGLLTRYQAAELTTGQWRGLWLGGYRVLDRLGKGGMSHVFLAEHAVLGKRVAVKVLSASLRADKIARRRFVREARAAAAIEHANIVHVFDVDMDHDPPYLVMEFVDGISLQAAVAGHGCFTGNETANVGAEIARGLAVAAEAGLVHRDIKPANLLLDRRGGVKILDLGIVRLLGDDTQPPGTESEEILGTLDYLAPEQAVNSAKVDTRADFYALGATLYFLLAGHPPFPGSNVRHKLAAKQYTDPPPIHRLRPDVDSDLSAVIHTLLARDPAARYQSATAVIEAISRFAALPTDYPMRFFRPLHGSTVTDGIADNRDSSSVPATLSIRKPVAQESANNPQYSNSSAEDDGCEQAPATLRISKALTDMVLTALPDNCTITTRKAETIAEVSDNSPQYAHSRVFWWLLLVSLICIAIIVIAFIWS
ncbi:MAG TPA: serine/threonine-protein kinase [Gemmata sp.]|jgi:serine/threonine-protein kinase|nr:serine/threonine-protein kinase [Gemmata sp.]